MIVAFKAKFLFECRIPLNGFCNRCRGKDVVSLWMDFIYSDMDMHYQCVMNSTDTLMIGISHSLADTFFCSVQNLL